VEVLKQVEEGEKRAYKIDVKALQIESMIGAGSFGYVYKGVYHQKRYAKWKKIFKFN
jgi:hypothetical protein